jgi:SRSO17 transposase
VSRTDSANSKRPSNLATTLPQLRSRHNEFEAAVPCRRAAADTVYRSLRHWLEERRQPLVSAVPSDEPLWWKGWEHLAASEITYELPSESWQRLSAGDGSKGPRLYDRAWTPLWRLQLTDEERQ